MPAYRVSHTQPKVSDKAGHSASLYCLTAPYQGKKEVSLTLSMSPPGSRATSLGMRLATNRASQFIMPLVGGGAAALTGPGSVFFLLGGSLLLLGFVGGRTLGIWRS